MSKIALAYLNSTRPFLCLELKATFQFHLGLYLLDGARTSGRPSERCLASMSYIFVYPQYTLERMDSRVESHVKTILNHCGSCYRYRLGLGSKEG